MPYIHVTLAAGRTLEAKQALMAAVTETVHTSIGSDPESIRVWITEIAPEEMSVGDVPLTETRARRTAATDR